MSKILDRGGKAVITTRRVVVTLIFDVPTQITDAQVGPLMCAGGINLSLGLGNLHKAIDIRMSDEPTETLLDAVKGMH